MELNKAITHFISAESKADKDKIFQLEIYPSLENSINGVFLSLNITSISYDEIQDIKQEIYIKLLKTFETKELSGIRSTKNFMFILIKNIVKNILISRQYKINCHNQFKESIVNIRIKWNKTTII